MAKGDPVRNPKYGGFQQGNPYQQLNPETGELEYRPGDMQEISPNNQHQNLGMAFGKTAGQLFDPRKSALPYLLPLSMAMSSAGGAGATLGQTGGFSGSSMGSVPGQMSQSLMPQLSSNAMKGASFLPGGAGGAGSGAGMLGGGINSAGGLGSILSKFAKGGVGKDLMKRGANYGMNAIANRGGNTPQGNAFGLDRLSSLFPGQGQGLTNSINEGRSRASDSINRASQRFNPNPMMAGDGMGAGIALPPSMAPMQGFNPMGGDRMSMISRDGMSGGTSLFPSSNNSTLPNQANNPYLQRPGFLSSLMGGSSGMMRGFNG